MAVTAKDLLVLHIAVETDRQRLGRTETELARAHDAAWTTP